MNKKTQLPKVFLLGLLVSLPAAAERMAVQMGTSFSCKSNAECKRKCEALGGRWKAHPNGSIWGECYLRPQSLSDLVLVSRASLAGEKQVNLWTDAGDFLGETGGAGNGLTAFLTPSECDALGGDVDYHADCSGTRLKCTTRDSKGKRRSVCIDELDKFVEPIE